MAYLRFSRDRRGYEQFSLVQPSNRRGGKSRPRLLYWFRSPPNVKVGREPFDPEVRRTLEARNPDVVFDWPAIVSTPIPPVEVENWRERRRAERAARQVADMPEPGEGPAAPEQDPSAPALPAVGDSEPGVPALPAAQAVSAAEPVAEEAPPTPSVEPEASVENSGPPALNTSVPGQGRRRRRRRRRRGGQARTQVAGSVQAVEPAIHEVGGADVEPEDTGAPDEEPAAEGPDEEV